MATAIQVLTLMLLLGQMNNYMMRTNLSILIVAMVKPDNNTNTTAASVATGPESSVQFEWDAFQRGVALSAFGYGYITTQIIGGRLAEHFGFKWVYGVGLFLSAIGTLLIPIMAKINFWAFFAIRFIIGVFEGFTIPAIFVASARWIPLSERSRFVARTFFGLQLGICINFPLCAWISTTWGWEAGFYVIGIETVIWFFLYCVLVFNTPEEHPRISEEELLRIRSLIPKDESMKERMSAPWIQMCTSIPFIGTVMADFMDLWGLNTLALSLPMYLHFLLGVDMQTVGYLAGVPSITSYLGALISSHLSDWAISKQKLSLVNVRRLAHVVSQIGPATAFILITIFHDKVEHVIIILAIGFFFTGASSSGHLSSFVDIAPNFAGTMFGISNTFAGGGTNFLVPTVVGLLTQANMTFTGWNHVFYISAAINIIGMIVYVAFISGDVQPWNNPNKMTCSK